MADMSMASTARLLDCSHRSRHSARQTSRINADSMYSGKALSEYFQRLKSTHAPMLFWARLHSGAGNVLVRGADKFQTNRLLSHC